jgi:V8-like Glu-specific endopeptidase
MAFEYLTKDERDAITDALGDAEIEYDRPLRARLLDGIDRQFRGNFLNVYPDPGDQLFYDLRTLNLVERLTNGTVPLAVWLGNAIRRFGIHADLRNLLESLMTKVTTHQRTVEPISKADVPALAAAEEVITDGIDDLLNVSFLTAGAACVPSVGKMLVPFVLNGAVGHLPSGDIDYGSGTGWLIANDLLMTNYHVVRLRPAGQHPSDDDLKQQVAQASVYFFQDAENQAGQKVSCGKLIAAGRTPETDYALLRLAEAPKIAPLRVSEEKVTMPAPVETAKGSVTRIFGVNIIQHPLGKWKRVALRNNKVYAAQYPHLYYYTDTLEGSSGSPVFDDDWRVIALHRASIAERSEYNGNKDVGYVNQGVQMNAIFADLGEKAKADAEVAAALGEIRGV